MSRKKIWRADELTEDVLLAEIPSDGSCDEEGASDNEDIIAGDCTVPPLEIPILIDDSTEVILEDDPLLAMETTTLPVCTTETRVQSINQITDPNRQCPILQAGPSTSFDLLFQSPTSDIPPLYLDLILSPSPVQNLQSPAQSPKAPTPNPTKNVQSPTQSPATAILINTNLVTPTMISDDVDDDLHDTPLIYRSDKKTFPWKLNHKQVDKVPFIEDTNNVFNGISTPTDMFFLLFPQELIDDIVYQTNLYVVQNNNGGTVKFPTNAKEIRNFLGMNIIMGVKRLPSYRDYWSANPVLRDSFISSIMPVNRFSWLLNNIHFADNSKIPTRNSKEYDKLYKVRPVLAKLSKTFSECYKPTQVQSVDESMIKFKGRSSLKQYMPKKPIKRGYKVWTRADSRGFVVQFDLYTGKINGCVEKNLGASVVKRLCKALEGKGYEVYIDNFFPSLELFDYLQRKQVYVCGTLQITRKFMPKKFKPDKEMERGDYQYRSTTTGITCLKWMDNKAVHFISNHHDPTKIVTAQRKQKDGTRITIPCPNLVKEYNAYMGFVDKADMLTACYAINRKSKRWYMRIFWHFIDVCVVNAFLAFGINAEGKQMDLKSFRLSVAQGLIRLSHKDKGKAKVNCNKFKVAVPLERRLTENVHLPVRSTWKRCHVCSTKEKQVRTFWECSGCHVSLCLNDKKNCFYDFHK